MSNLFRYGKDPLTGSRYLETALTGKALMSIPQLNKGTAFSLEERWTFGLQGKLPFAIETIDQQADRCYQQYIRFKTPLEKNIYLKNLHNINETLFYYLVRQHLDEMLPVIYTPTVGEAVKTYSLEFRRARGLYIAYPDRHRIPELLKQRTNPAIDIIVASDAEGVLGIGDQGVGGMDIPVAKLMVYTLCAGLHPSRYLPVFLDAGTNNKALLEDPFYLGWRHERVRGDAYDEMMYLFVKAVKENCPDVFLHWEDFGRDNARRNLERFKDELCSFNDDMQGTGAVTVSALLAATKAANLPFNEQKIVIFGAGTAGAGIADQICQAMIHAGLSEQEAKSRFWFIDRAGLLLNNMDFLADFQKPYARDSEEVTGWFKLADGSVDLSEVVRRIKPTTLIGCSTKAGAFNSTILRAMAASQEYPIIFPLSNPTELAEATPEEILKYTDGKALIATGSPFGGISFQGKHRRIAQCNNALVFPGIGLGVIAIGARKLTNGMLWAACEALSNYAPVKEDITQPLLPPLGQALEVSFGVAKAVAQQAIAEGVSSYEQLSEVEVEQKITDKVWHPQYYPYKLIADK